MEPCHCRRLGELTKRRRQHPVQGGHASPQRDNGSAMQVGRVVAEQFGFATVSFAPWLGTRYPCAEVVNPLYFRATDSSISRRPTDVEIGISYVAKGSRPCENAPDEASGSAVSAAAAITQRVEFSGEGPAPYAFIAAISGPAPRILIARFRL